MAATALPPLSRAVVAVTDATAAAQWLKAQLCGVLTPGTIPVGGMKGFRRHTGWDKLAGKGTAGATLVRKNKPPIEGTVTLQLVTAKDFADWDSFVEQVLDLDASAQGADGLSWYYPGHASIRLTTVVVQHYTGIEYQGRGVYHASFELLEWSPPPAASVVATVAATSPDESGGSAPKPQDPRIVALEKQIAAASAANEAP